MGLAAWFRHDEEPGKCPYARMHGATVWEMCGSSDAGNASINNAMAADSRFLMRVVLEEYGETIFRGVDSLVDVAGGVGGSSATIAAAFPSLKLTVLDLPHLVAKAPSVSNVQSAYPEIRPSPCTVKRCRSIGIFRLQVPPFLVVALEVRPLLSATMLALTWSPLEASTPATVWRHTTLAGCRAARR